VGRKRLITPEFAKTGRGLSGDCPLTEPAKGVAKNARRQEQHCAKTTISAVSRVGAGPLFARMTAAENSSSSSSATQIKAWLSVSRVPAAIISLHGNSMCACVCVCV